MTKTAKIIGILGIVLGAFLAGAWYSGRPSSSPNAAGGRKILRYICPMHPQYTSDRPGDAPCCGMRLVPVYEDGGTEAAAPPSSSSLVRGAVYVSHEKQQLIGIRLGTADQWSGMRNLRANARIAADENRLYRLNAATEMWIRKIHPATTGSIVRKDEPLLNFYAANFLSAANAYLYALNTRDRQIEAKASAPQMEVVGFQIRQAVESLQNIGVSDTDIAEMEKSRKPRDLVTLRSPADGYILSRTATQGQWIAPSTELYQIADLSRVWIYADLFENEARHIRPGQTVKASLPNQDVTFNAIVSDVPPVFDPTTRTMRVRMEAANRGLGLWPGMFVDVEFPIHLPPTITVPSSAVLDSGLKKTVFVARGNGVFEPRLVETGWRFGDRVAVLKGLEAGERIVVSGNFLIDSESRMQHAASGSGGTHADQGVRPTATAKDPVCGMDVDPSKAAGKSEYRGRTHYFCNEGCKKKFDANPEKYVVQKKSAKS